jgi:hypothetical protein
MAGLAPAHFLYGPPVGAHLGKFFETQQRIPPPLYRGPRCP